MAKMGCFGQAAWLRKVTHNGGGKWSLPRYAFIQNHTNGMQLDFFDSLDDLSGVSIILSIFYHQFLLQKPRKNLCAAKFL